MIARVMLLGLFVCGVTMMEAGESDHNLPNIVSASVPFYPQLPRVQRVSGTVHLTVVTDGKKAIEVKAKDGHPLLVKAAIANVKTWEFQEHVPVAFETVFTYVIKDVSPCHARDPKHRTVTVALPAWAEITTTPPGECDPVTQEANK